MMTKAMLFDLLGPKVLASKYFFNEQITRDFLLSVVDKYSEHMSELMINPVAASIDGNIVYLSRVNESTLVVATTDSQESIEEELQAVESIGTKMRTIVATTPVRDAKNMFAPMVDDELRKRIHVCFICDSKSPQQNHSGSAALRMAKILNAEESSRARVANVGPFSVYVTQMTIDQIADS